MLLRSALWHLGLRFRKHASNLPGKPDIVFARARVALFCDGDFWHGRKWPELEQKLQQGTNPGYWVAKIAANRQRDEIHTRTLTDAGWLVLRIWEMDIKRAPEATAEHIARIVRARQADPACALDMSEI